MHFLIGSLNWLAISTRPGIATITNILEKYKDNLSKGHIDAVKRVVGYLKGTLNHGLAFHSHPSDLLRAFFNFSSLQSTASATLTGDLKIKSCLVPKILLSLSNGSLLSLFLDLSSFILVHSLDFQTPNGYCSQ